MNCPHEQVGYAFSSGAYQVLLRALAGRPCQCVNWLVVYPAD